MTELKREKALGHEKPSKNSKVTIVTVRDIRRVNKASFISCGAQTTAPKRRINGLESGLACVLAGV